MLCSARPRKAPSAWGDVEDFEGDWRRIRRGAVVGRTVSELFQSAAGRRLCRIRVAPAPWRSGSVAHEQGVSKAGNPRLRTTG
jgi:transposase